MLKTKFSRRLAVLLGLLIAFFLILPQFISEKPYVVNVFVLVFYMTTVSMAWNLLGGMTGQNSMGHACFVGIGAYTTALFLTNTNINPWIVMIFAVLLTGIIAGLVFSQCFILRGPYFTLVTIAFAECIRQIILNWDFAGKAIGIQMPRLAKGWASFRFTSKVPYYYVAFGVMIAVYLLMKYIDNSKLGFALKTIREDEDVAAAIGIKPLKYKVIAVVISAMVTGLCGFFYANYYRYIDADMMLQSQSVEFVLPAIIGGAAFVEGPLVGGLILIPLSEFLRNEFGGILPGINLILYAVVLIVVIRFRPTGILGWFSHSRFKDWLVYKVLGKEREEEGGSAK